MIPARLTDYLDHMQEAARLACSYVEGLDKEDFLEDKRTQQAVILNLILIGEEATRILKDHEAFANSHPQIPWRSMKGMRNRMPMVTSKSIWTWSGKPSSQPFPT